MKTDSPTHDVRRRAMEMAVATAGHTFPRLSALQPPAALAQRFPAATSGYSIVLLDVTLDITGEFRLIEANGSNAALSSLSAPGDVARAAHMFAALAARYSGDPPSVALLGHQKGFLHIAEFFGRAGLFAEFANARWPTRLRAPDERLGKETLAVVASDLGSLARHCRFADEQWEFRGRPIVFASNANLLPELERRGCGLTGAPMLQQTHTVFHEGTLVALIHDKCGQQNIAEGTGITPLLCADAAMKAEALAAANRLRIGGRALVLKMNAGSGGAGVEFIPPWMEAHAIADQWDALVASARRKYGRAIERTLYPVRLFEFAQSTPYLIAGRPHLWDLRLQCLISPGSVEISPCVVRLCPEPFDERTFGRNSVVSNLTGRTPSLRFMRSARAPSRIGGRSTLDRCGLTPERYQDLLQSCVRWCERAMGCKEAAVAPELGETNQRRENTSQDIAHRPNRCHLRTAQR